MPRPKLNREDSLYEHFLSKGATLLNLEELKNNSDFNACTYVTIQCKNNPEHTYRHCISNIKRKNIDITSCVHCSLAEKYSEKGIQLALFQEYADKNNLSIYNKQLFYSRWGDSITFICNACTTKIEIKALAHFEKHTIKQDFKCECCEILAKGLLTDEDFNKQLDTMKVVIKYEDITPEVPVLKKVPSSECLEKIKMTNFYVIEYNGTREKSIFQCKTCGNKKECIVSNLFHPNAACNNCFLAKQKANLNDKIIKLCRDNKIQLLSNYVDMDTPVQFKCNKCGLRFEKTRAKIDIHREQLSCPDCHKKVNREQNTVATYVSELIGKEPDQNNRTLIKPLELDIVINNTLAIEYCGTIWHSSRFGKTTTYHRDKLDACAAKNIRLLTIFDDEWKHKNDICKSRIKNALGLVTNKIPGRKCEVKLISNSSALEFCSKNHIQDKGQAYHSYGLFYQDRLVSVMTFSKPSPSKGGKVAEYDWELNRFCSELDTIVIGGATKLLAAFKKVHPGDCIVTFCDLRWGTGRVYEKMGFTLLHKTRPNYYYAGEYTNWERKHRFGFTKQKLMKLFNETDITLTERQIAEKNGLMQIFDCGHLKFIMNKKSQ